MTDRGWAITRAAAGQPARLARSSVQPGVKRLALLVRISPCHIRRYTCGDL